MKIRDNTCPQCGHEAVLTGDDKESFLECDWCGHREVRTSEGRTSWAGYGSIHMNGNVLLFTKNSSSQVINRIVKLLNDSDGLYLWDKKKLELVPIVGSLPLTEEQFYERQADEQKYYSSFNNNHDSDDCVPFN